MLYGRVSKLARGRKARQDPLLRPEGKSVDQQLAEMTAQAEREGVQIVGVFRDDGVSASRFGGGKDRDGWKQVMELLLAGGVDELWAWEISRATRDRPVWATLVNTCIAQSAKISVGGKVHDPSDPDDGFMLDLQAALAVRESAVTSKRILRDVAARAAQGKPHGKVPYGYTRVYDPHTRVLIEQVKDPETAPVLEEIAQRVLAGESLYKVARDLDRRGIPSPEAVRARRAYGETVATEWRCETIRSLLVSPTAAGQRVHRGHIVSIADWPAIVDAADHEALVRMFTDRPARRNFQPGVVKHLLSGIAECGVCGTPLRRAINRGNPSYVCPGPQRRGDACVARSQEPLEALVVSRVVERLLDPSLLESMARVRAGAGQRATEAAGELERLQAQLASFVAAATRGEVSAESFGLIEKGLRDKIAAATARRGVTSSIPSAVLAMAGPNADRAWDDLDGDLHRQRLVVRSLFRVVVHRSARRGMRVFDPSAVEIIPLG